MNPGDKLKPESDQALLQYLQQIRGVRAASVIRDQDGQVSEVHLVASMSRRAKQIVRDVESLLYAQFGIPIDYRKISLVQLDSETVTSSRSRLKLVRVAQQATPDERVQVLLQSENVSYEGTASLANLDSDDHKARAAAQATLAAIQEATGHCIPLEVRDLQLLEPQGQRVCLALIVANTASGEERLSGSCLVAESILEAGCKATLDALNRRLPVWARQQGSDTPGGAVKAPLL